MSKIQDRVFGMVGRDDLAGALALIHEAKRDATGAALGTALWLEAWVLSKPTPRQAHKAKALLVEAFPLLTDALDELAHAITVGCYYATLSYDTALHAAIVKLTRRVLEDTSPHVQPWHGRMLNLQGQYWMGPGKDLTKAEAAIRKSITWHQNNVGPHGEHDRRCHLRHALVALARLHLRRGERGAAEARVDEAGGYLDTARQAYTLLHVEGMIAAQDQRDGQAIDAYERAMADAHRYEDWVALVEIAASYAEVLRRRQDWQRLDELLRPLVKVLYQAGIPEGAHRLQMLNIPTRREEEITV